MFDFRYELAAGQFFLDQLAERRRQVDEAVGPADFVAFCIDQRDALVRCGDREGAHGHDAFVRFAIFGR